MDCAKWRHSVNSAVEQVDTDCMPVPLRQRARYLRIRLALSHTLCCPIYLQLP